MSQNQVLTQGLMIETKQGNDTALFEKRTIVELNDNELADVNGGTGAVCVSASMAVVASVVQMGQWGYEFGQWLR